MRFVVFFFLTILAGFTALPHDAFAVRSETIVMVVNEDAITRSDLNDRLALIMASSGLPPSQDTVNKLTPQIVGALVDEQIRLQEARRLDLSVSQVEIDEGFAEIAKQNNFTPEQFREMINKGGLNIKTMEDQIRAQLAWTKVIQTRLRPQVIISDSDVDSYLKRIRDNIGQPEYLVAEIFLPVDSGDAERDVQQLAIKLASEIRSGQAPFPKVAQQFSKSAGATNGGDLGWIAQGQLQQELDRVLPQLEPGAVSNPIRSTSGYHIITVREKRLVSEESLPSEGDVRQIIGLQRLERLQRRLLLDLKSSAFIDNRLADLPTDQDG